MFSICVTHKQFFGDPILCDAGHASGGINSDVLGENFDLCIGELFFNLPFYRHLLLDVLNIWDSQWVQRSV